jgi:outer membrane protein assembly factor BamB
LATGETDKQGSENFVIALDRFDPNMEIWNFSYSENNSDVFDDICYYSTPVVYEDKVIITSWSGDSDFIQSNKNNFVFALNLVDGSKLWEYELPAGSYSTPAIFNKTVVIGCNNKRGNSLFALYTENGSLIWKKSVGAIGRSSPVIYKDRVFVVSEVKKIIRSSVKVTSLYIKNGSIISEATIGRNFFTLLHFLFPTQSLADSTPAIHKDVLYVSSPNGYIFALDATDLSKQVWKTSVESLSLMDNINGNYLSTSPAFTDGCIYIGTPSGHFYALETSNGNKKEGWKEWRTFERKFIDGNWETTDAHPPVVTSPIVSNGLVFFGDNNGKLYSLGKFKKPEDKEISGSVISIPIRLPDQYWWDKFYGKDDKIVSNKNSISFSILDEEKNHIKDITTSTSIANEDFTDRSIRLRADLYAKNISFNPKLLDWRVTFIKDIKAPLIEEGSFKPEGGWINKTTPVCKVEVKDEGTGLLLSESNYTLYYYINDSIIKEYSGKPEYTGKNGAPSSVLSVDISNLNFSQDITKLENITFSIKDFANNEDSKLFDFKQDFLDPFSSIDKGQMKESYTYSPIIINADARDPGKLNKDASGVAIVDLKYRFSQTGDFSGEWKQYSDAAPRTPTTIFNARWEFTDIQGGGWYQLCTVATDARGNKENLPTDNATKIVTFILDPNPPNKPQFTVPSWFNTTPKLSAVFSDDFLLDLVEYRPNFESEWIEIKSDINAISYTATWTLLSRYWEQMEEGETHYLYFRLVDSLGNIRTITNMNEAFRISKDVSEPIVDLEIPDIEAEWSWDDTFNISVFADDINGSGIDSVELFYRYSEDNETWNNWTLYEGKLYSTPFEWKFRAEDGNGHYEFYVRAEDEAGNIAISPVFATGVNIFPMLFIISLVILIFALFISTIFLFIIWRKKK